MKKIDYLLPEMPVMVRLLKLIDKYTVKISKVKQNIRKIEDIAKAVEKVQTYNFERFSFVRLYQEQCNRLYDEEKDFTYSLYQERFDDGYVKACFLDEANCLFLIKNAKIPGWDCDPSSPDFSFYLNYFILEALDFESNPEYIRNCMDYFVSNNETLDKYRKGVTNLFYKKRKARAFSDEYDKERFEDLSWSIKSLFSMKCEPNDYVPVFEPYSVEDLEAAEKEVENKRKNSVLKLTKEDLERISLKLNFNPHGNPHGKER